MNIFRGCMAYWREKSYVTGGGGILSISCSKVWENKRGFGRGFEDL